MSEGDWNKVSEFDTSYIIVFIFGVMIKEIHTFISEGGLTGDYPLSKSLFIMFLCMLSLGIMTLIRARKTVEGLERLKMKLETQKEEKMQQQW